MHRVSKTTLLIATLVSAIAVADKQHRSPAPYYSSDSTDLMWFMHISDVHLGKSNRQTDAFRYALTTARRSTDPAFIVNTGDVVDGEQSCEDKDNEPKQWEAYKNIINDTGTTPDMFFDVVGNHEIGTEGGLQLWRDNSLQGVAGNAAAQYSWEVGGHLFYAANSEGEAMNLDMAPCQDPGCCDEWTHGIDTHTSYLTVHNLSPMSSAFSASRGRVKFVFMHRDLAPDIDTDFINELADSRAYLLRGHTHKYKERFINAITGFDQGGQPVEDQSRPFMEYTIGSLGVGHSASSNPCIPFDPKFTSGRNIGMVAIDHNLVVYRPLTYSDCGATDPFPATMITAPAAAYFKYADPADPEDIENDGIPNPIPPQYTYSVCKDQRNDIRALVFSDPNGPPISSVVGAFDGLPAVYMTEERPRVWTVPIDTSSLSTGDHDVSVTVNFNEDGIWKERTDQIQAHFVAGQQCGTGCCTGSCASGVCTHRNSDFGTNDPLIQTPNLSPPTVGPAFDCGESVAVSGVVPGASVTLYVDHVPTNFHYTASQILPTGSGTFVLPFQLQKSINVSGVDTPGHVITASQQLNGATSGISNRSLVEGLPTTLPAPWPGPAPIYECGMATTIHSYPGLTSHLYSSTACTVGGCPAVATAHPVDDYGSAVVSSAAFGQSPNATIWVDYSACNGTPITSTPIYTTALPQTLNPPTLKPVFDGVNIVQISDYLDGAHIRIFRHLPDGTNVEVADEPQAGGPTLMLLQAQEAPLPALPTLGEQLFVQQWFCQNGPSPNANHISPPSDYIDVKSCDDLNAPIIVQPSSGDEYVTLTDYEYGAHVRVYANDPTGGWSSATGNPSGAYFIVGEGTGPTLKLTSPISSGQSIALAGGQTVVVSQSVGTCNAQANLSVYDAAP